MTARLRAVVTGLLLIAAGVGVWFGRRVVFAEQEREFDRQRWASTHPTYGPALNLSRPGRWEWNYPRSASLQQGEAQFRLVLARHPTVAFEHYQREKMLLRLRVSVFQASGSERRQVIATVFPVDRPDVGSSHGGGYTADEVEHNIGTVHLDPAFQTIFVVDVETPDAELESARPRLKVVGAYDHLFLVKGGPELWAIRALMAGVPAFLLMKRGFGLLVHSARPG